MRITEKMLKRLINEERQRLNETLEMGLKHPSDAHKRTREVQAKDMSSTLEKCVDYYKTCCIKEGELKRELKKIREMKRRLKSQMKDALED